MNDDDLRDFVTLVSDALAYWKQPVSEFALHVWTEGCKGYTVNQVAKAIQAYATDPDRGHFAPKVSDIIRLIDGSAEDRAALAWGKVLEAASSVGAYQDVCFDDPVIHSAIMDCGGWPAICRTETDSLNYAQHRFCEAYRAYIGRQSDHPGTLRGDRSADSEYEKKGLPVPRPVLIGDSAKAIAVQLAGSKSGKTPIDFSGGSIKMIAGNVH